MNYIVIAVDTEDAPDRHKHIVAVCTDSRQKFTRAQVIASIGAGNTWYTQSRYGTTSKIVVVSKCSKCSLAPYIRTEADTTTTDNLLSLPAC